MSRLPLRLLTIASMLGRQATAHPPAARPRRRVRPDPRTIGQFALRTIRSSRNSTMNAVRSTKKSPKNASPSAPAPVESSQ